MRRSAISLQVEALEPRTALSTTGSSVVGPAPAPPLPSASSAAAPAHVCHHSTADGSSTHSGQVQPELAFASHANMHSAHARTFLRIGDGQNTPTNVASSSDASPQGFVGPVQAAASTTTPAASDAHQATTGPTAIASVTATHSPTNSLAPPLVTPAPLGHSLLSAAAPAAGLLASAAGNAVLPGTGALLSSAGPNPGGALAPLASNDASDAPRRRVDPSLAPEVTVPDHGLVPAAPIVPRLPVELPVAAGVWIDGAALEQAIQSFLQHYDGRPGVPVESPQERSLLPWLGGATVVLAAELVRRRLSRNRPNPFALDLSDDTSPWPAGWSDLCLPDRE